MVGLLRILICDGFVAESLCFGARPLRHVVPIGGIPRTATCEFGRYITVLPQFGERREDNGEATPTRTKPKRRKIVGVDQRSLLGLQPRASSGNSQSSGTIVLLQPLHSVGPETIRGCHRVTVTVPKQHRMCTL